MIQAEYLKQGDKVIVIAPSGVVSRDLTEEGIAILESWGLDVERGANLYAVNGIFAGTDKERLHDLQLALDDTVASAVICARGGYGLSRIISDIDFSTYMKNPSWLVGYSDITVLHMWINNFLGIKTIHGEMLLNFTNSRRSADTLESLRKALFGEPEVFEWQAPVVREGNAEGILVGGNLSLIYNLMGSPLADKLKKKILFIEDTSEYKYSVDRMMMGLKNSGVLASLSGLVIGGMSDMKESATVYGAEAEDIIIDAVKDYDYPVASGFPAGHIYDNRSLIMGDHISFRADKESAGIAYK